MQVNQQVHFKTAKDEMHRKGLVTRVLHSTKKESMYEVIFRLFNQYVFASNLRGPMLLHFLSSLLLVHYVVLFRKGQGNALLFLCVLLPFLL